MMVFFVERQRAIITSFQWIFQRRTFRRWIELNNFYSVATYNYRFSILQIHYESLGTRGICKRNCFWRFPLIYCKKTNFNFTKKGGWERVTAMLLQPRRATLMLRLKFKTLLLCASIQSIIKACAMFSPLSYFSGFLYEVVTFCYILHHKW